MADFVQSANVKSATRTLAEPIADIAAFNTIVQSVITTNSFAGVEYMTAGKSHPPYDDVHYLDSHWMYPRAGTRQRCDLSRSRNIGFSAGLSARELIERWVAVMSFAQCGTRPHCIIMASARSCATITRFVLPGAMLKCDLKPMVGSITRNLP